MHSMSSMAHMHCSRARSTGENGIRGDSCDVWAAHRWSLMRRVCGNRGYSPVPALQIRAQHESTLGSDDGSYAKRTAGHSCGLSRL